MSIAYDKTKNYSQLTSGDILYSSDFRFPLEVRLQNPEIPYSVVVVCNPVGEISETVDDKQRELDYNIFSGEKMSSIIDGDHRDSILATMKIITNVTIEFMTAGYHLYNDEEDDSVYNKKRIPDWIINFQYPVLRMFRLYYGIVTSCEDIAFADEFLDNPQFRQMITDVMMRLVANFAATNLDLQDLSSDEVPINWTELNTYIKIYDMM